MISQEKVIRLIISIGSSSFCCSIFDILMIVSMFEIICVAIVGGGLVGLMVVEVANVVGLQVDLFEVKGSVGCKFFIVGKGGFNLIYGELWLQFDVCYGERVVEIVCWLDIFDVDVLCVWACGLGVEIYVGSSGRVFPNDRKAVLLLRPVS